MNFGVMLNHQYLKGEDLGKRLEEGVEATELMRDLGYDSLFSHHHYLANLQTPQCVPILASLVPYAGTMRLGVGVYIVTLEHPVQLAENFATLDQLCGGRLIMGVGAGYRENEFATFGIDRSTRQSRFAETLDLLRAFWTGEEVTFHGRHFTIEGESISVVPRQPKPPIWIGANGPKTIARAAQLGDAWIGSPHLKVKWANGNLASFQEALAANGVDPAGREYPIIRELYVADSDEAAKAEVDQYIRNEYLAFSNYDPIYKEHYEDMWNKSFLVGSPDTVAEKLQAHVDGGWNHFVFRCSWPGMPGDMTLRTIRRFAEEVMPRFKAADRTLAPTA